METDKITCEQMKKPNAIKYFKSLNPFLRNITDFIASYKYAQTPEMLEYFKSKNPSVGDVFWLLVHCKYTQTPEMLEYFKSLNPSEKEIKHMLQFYKKLRRKNLKKQ